MSNKGLFKHENAIFCIGSFAWRMNWLNMSLNDAREDTQHCYGGKPEGNMYFVRKPGHRNNCGI